MPVAAGFAECSIMYQHQTLPRPAYSVFGVNPASADPDAIAAAVFGAWTTTGGFQTLIDNQVTIGPVTVRFGTDGSGDIVAVGTLTVAGAASGSTCAPNTAVLFRKRTARGGRRGRGRLYLPWAVRTADLAENGVISAPTVTAMNTCAATVRNALSTQSCPMVVLHSPGNTLPGAPDLVTALNVDPLIATQRRRLGR